MQPTIDASMALLQQAEAEFAPDIVFACSFGAEDVTLLDLISRCARSIVIVTLDTGRLPQQTYDVMDACRARYGMPIEAYFPAAAEVEFIVREAGPNLFRESVEKRKLCCEIRKIHPLRRALAGRKAWLTGVRREQAGSRQQMAAIEHDEQFDIKKINPLIEWSEADVWSYIRAHDVPYNALHDAHYPSIGCAPCTRAIAVGENPRAGRWWWEQEDGVAECGLHASPVKRKS